MLILRLDSSCFWVRDKIKQPRASVVLGQPEAKTKLPEADVLLAGLDQIPSGVDSRKTFLMNHPGEYDIKDISIKGIQDDGHIIYLLEIDGERLVYLEGLGNASLPDRQIEQLGDVHILIISIGGGPDAQSAAKLINRIEPRLVVPMGYKEEDLKQFLKIVGIDKQTTDDSLNVQADQLSEEELTVKVLKAP